MQVIDLTHDGPHDEPDSTQSAQYELPVESLFNYRLPVQRNIVTDAAGRNNNASSAIDLDADDEEDIVFLRTEEPRVLQLPQTGLVPVSSRDDGDAAARWMGGLLTMFYRKSSTNYIYTQTADVLGRRSDGANIFSRDAGGSDTSGNGHPAGASSSHSNRALQATSSSANDGLTIHDEAPLVWSNNQARHGGALPTPQGPMGEAAAMRRSLSYQNRLRTAAHAPGYSGYNAQPNAQPRPRRPEGNTGLYDELLRDALSRDGQYPDEDMAARPGGAVRAVGPYLDLAHVETNGGPANNNNNTWWARSHYTMADLFTAMSNRFWGGPANYNAAQAWPGPDRTAGRANYYPGSVVSAADEKRRRSKKYSVKQSHPNYVKKIFGFSRDVIPPPEVEEEQEADAEEHQQPSNVDKPSENKDAPPKQTTRTERWNVERQVKGGSPSTNGNDKHSIGREEPDEVFEEDDFDDNYIIAKPLSPQSKANRRAQMADAAALRQQGMTSTLRDTAIASSEELVLDEAIPHLDIAQTLPENSAGPTFSNDTMQNVEHSTSLSLFQGSDPSLPVAPRTRHFAAPVCASCLEPLYLHQSAARRPYLLLCAHIVCHTCLDSARARANVLVNAPIDIEVPDMVGETEKGDDGWQGTPFKEKFEEVVAPLPDAPKTKGKRKRGISGVAAPDRRRGKKSKTSDAPKSSSTRTSSRLHVAATYSDAFAGSSDDDESKRTGDGEAYRPTPTPEEEQTSQTIAAPTEPVSIKKSRGAKKSAMVSAPEEQATTAKKNKGKGRATATTPSEPVVDPKWVTCPIVGCKGEQTDLLAKAGSRTGPWEMFV
ncbi:hypothetical protein EMMF5_000697 [Cystobasidiomycetes sp. EMM_F5]